jgi:putative membrane protein
MDYYLYAKSLHIIFITTWFAGLFYIVRLFIYFKEAEENKSSGQDILQKQYRIMIKRLWYMITWPSAILATIFAV